MSKIIGIIAEDESDVNSARVLIHRIANNDRIKIKHFLGKGCGKLIKKCYTWAQQLHLKGCSYLIVIHDLDNKIHSKLEEKIKLALNPCPIKKHLICTPIKELE